MYGMGEAEQDEEAALVEAAKMDQAKPKRTYDGDEDEMYYAPASRLIEFARTWHLITKRQRDIVKSVALEKEPGVKNVSVLEVEAILKRLGGLNLDIEDGLKFYIEVLRDDRKEDVASPPAKKTTKPPEKKEVVATTTSYGAKPQFCLTKDNVVFGNNEGTRPFNGILVITPSEIDAVLGARDWKFSSVGGFFQALIATAHELQDRAFELEWDLVDIPTDLELLYHAKSRCRLANLRTVSLTTGITEAAAEVVTKIKTVVSSGTVNRGVDGMPDDGQPWMIIQTYATRRPSSPYAKRK